MKKVSGDVWTPEQTSGQFSRSRLAVLTETKDEPLVFRRSVVSCELRCFYGSGEETNEVFVAKALHMNHLNVSKCSYKYVSLSTSGYENFSPRADFNFMPKVGFFFHLFVLEKNLTSNP